MLAKQSMVRTSALEECDKKLQGDLNSARTKTAANQMNHALASIIKVLPSLVEASFLVEVPSAEHPTVEALSVAWLRR